MKHERISGNERVAIERRALGEAGFAIDAVADAATGRGRLHRHSWFQADADATGRTAEALIARRPDGAPAIALPIVRAGRGMRMVPGCYWPQRSFPVAADAGGKITSSYKLNVMKLDRTVTDTRGAEVTHALSERTTFVITPDSKVIATLSSADDKVAPDEHALKSLEIVQKLKK